MRRSKKFIVAVVLATVVLVGGVGGAVLAQNGNEGENQPQSQRVVLLDRVCAIYEENTGVAIDSEELQKAFNKAQDEMRAAAMEARLAKMVENGVIDEAQAQELQEWWESRPDVPIRFGFMGPGGEKPFARFGGPGGFEPPPPPE